MITLARIVSGGQTGVDRGALDAALAAGFPCGGWCPEGRMAEDGAIPPHYPLTELPGADYKQRTKRNVMDSDGTLVIYSGNVRRTDRFTTIGVAGFRDANWWATAFGETS